MHPAIRLLTRLWLAIGLVIVLTTLTACGGGGDDCTDREQAQWRLQCEAGHP